MAADMTAQAAADTKLAKIAGMGGSSGGGTLSFSSSSSATVGMSWSSSDGSKSTIASSKVAEEHPSSIVVVGVPLAAVVELYRTEPGGTCS